MHFNGLSLFEDIVIVRVRLTTVEHHICKHFRGKLEVCHAWMRVRIDPRHWKPASWNGVLDHKSFYSGICPRSIGENCHCYAEPFKSDFEGFFLHNSLHLISNLWTFMSSVDPGTGPDSLLRFQSAFPGQRECCRLISYLKSSSKEMSQCPIQVADVCKEGSSLLGSGAVWHVSALTPGEFGSTRGQLCPSSTTWPLGLKLRLTHSLTI